MMEVRESHCRGEAARLSERARSAATKVEHTKSMARFYLMSRDMARVEDLEFALRAQKNSQDSVRLLNHEILPMTYRRMHVRIDGVFEFHGTQRCRGSTYLLSSQAPLFALFFAAAHRRF